MQNQQKRLLLKMNLFFQLAFCICIKVDEAVLHYIQEMIVMKKPELWTAFQQVDPNYTLTVHKHNKIQNL